MFKIVTFLLCLLVVVYAKLEEDSDESFCPNSRCSGEGYECRGGQCYCSQGYIPNPFQNRCVRCPGLGEKCFSRCCDKYDETKIFTCWQGVCQSCHDSQNTWICRESLDNILLVSSTQVAMATALILGIIATFVLLYKLCAVTTLRPLGNRTNSESRLSIGSLQVYVDERLRDAPPRYSGASVPGSAAVPATVFVNAGFIHDSSIPPPPYTPQKEEETQNTAIHI